MNKSELKKLIKETIVKELFDTKEKINWETEGHPSYGEDFIATFVGPNNRTYEILLISMSGRDLPNEVFELADKFLPSEIVRDFFRQGYGVEFYDEEEGMEITGAGGADSSKIGGIIINAVVDKVKQQKINYLFFSAEKASRQKLYKKIAPILASKLGMKQVNNGEYYFLYK